MEPKDLWKAQPGKYFFLSTKKSGTWKDHPIAAGDWSAVDKLLDEYWDADVYMCPHGFSEPSRLKEHSVDPFLLYADLDEADPRTVSIKPTIAIESSPGRFVGYWITDKPANEELNRRLAYLIGADTSGWDRTQVLRVPDTRNHKYEDRPRVKLLWDNGPKYKVAQLEKMLPEGVAPIKPDDTHAAKLYKRYERVLSRWVRSNLFSGDPRKADRSRVLWKLQNELLEAGLSSDEVFALLWASPWNKFQGRRGGEDQLRRELDKNLDRRVKGSDPTPPDRGWDPLPRPISQVDRRDIEWIVPGLLARQELTIIEGDPGLGKSYFVQALSGLVCDGKSMPVFNHKLPVGRVAYFDTENTADTVTKARLVENGVVNLDNYSQGEDHFSIDEEERWSAVVNRLREFNPTLVVFDTINTYIGGADTHKASETQQAMGFFKDIARECNCSVILIRHLNKSGGNKAIYRGQGSIAFAGSARIIATVGKLPDDESMRTVSSTKNNLSKPFRSFTYSIESLPDRDGFTNRSKLVWGDWVDLSSDEIVEGVKKERKDNVVETAKEFLQAILEKEGKADINTALRNGAARGIHKNDLYRAADAMELIRKPIRRGEYAWVPR